MDYTNYQKYINNFKVVQSNGSVASNCAETTFINMHPTAVATINNVLPLSPGASISFDGAVGEIDVTNYTISFPNNSGLCIVVQKFYQD
jgi:hypothetical protein